MANRQTHQRSFRTSNGLENTNPIQRSVYYDSVHLHPMDAMRIAAFIMALESTYRISIGGSHLLRGTGPAVTSVAYIIYGVLELMFAIWALYLASAERRRMLTMNMFATYFAMLTVVLITILILDVRDTRTRADSAYMECKRNPTLFGVGYTIQDSRARCEQQAVGNKFTAMLLEGIRFVFQLLLIVVIFRFREFMLRQETQDIALSHYGLASRTECAIYPDAHLEPAPAYVATPFRRPIAGPEGTAAFLARMDEASPPYQATTNK